MPHPDGFRRIIPKSLFYPHNTFWHLIENQLARALNESNRQGRQGLSIIPYYDKCYIRHWVVSGYLKPGTKIKI